MSVSTRKPVATAYTVRSYSDYSADAIFERREDAEAHAERVNRLDQYAEAAVEEHELYPPGHAPACEVTWFVRVYRDGRADAWSDITWDYAAAAGEPRPPARPTLRVLPYGEVHAHGAEREATLKAAKDRWGRLRAEQEGIG